MNELKCKEDIRKKLASHLKSGVKSPLSLEEIKALKKEKPYMSTAGYILSLKNPQEGVEILRTELKRNGFEALQAGAALALIGEAGIDKLFKSEKHSSPQTMPFLTSSGVEYDLIRGAFILLDKEIPAPFGFESKSNSLFGSGDHSFLKINYKNCKQYLKAQKT